MRYFISFLAVLALAVSVNEVINDSVDARVMTGEYELWCDFGKGMVKVDREKITGTLNGKWIFTNGYA